MNLLRPVFARKTLREAARDFMHDQAAVQPAEFGQLLERAHEDLQALFPRTGRADIEAAALAAWANAEADRANCYVDLEASTPTLLWLVDQVAGVRRPIPVADLVRMLGPRVAG